MEQDFPLRILHQSGVTHTMVGAPAEGPHSRYNYLFVLPLRAATEGRSALGVFYRRKENLWERSMRQR